MKKVSWLVLGVATLGLSVLAPSTSVYAAQKDSANTVSAQPTEEANQQTQTHTAQYDLGDTAGRSGYRMIRYMETSKHSRFYNPDSGLKRLWHNIVRQWNGH